MGAIQLTRADVLRVAAEAACTVETVKNYCRGRRMYGLTEGRITQALRALGFEPGEVRGSEPLSKAV